MVKLVIVFILFFSKGLSAHAGVNIYDSSEPGYVLVEIIDDCEFSHKLLISLTLLESSRVSDWLDLLFVSEEWNKCLTKSTNNGRLML